MRPLPRWLFLAVPGAVVAASGFVSWRVAPLMIMYWDVGRLLPAPTFSLQIAALAVNAALFAGFVALASAISRMSRTHREPRRARPNGASMFLSAAIVVLLVYLYPVARTRLLFPELPDAGSPVASVDHDAQA